MKFTLFKIMNDDGRFSTGGTSIKFTKNGKTWTTRAGLSNHITQIANIQKYIGCQLVSITENGTTSEPIEPYIYDKLKAYYDRELKDSTSRYDARRKEIFEHDMEILKDIINKKE